MIANDGHREKEPPYRYWFSDGKYAHQLYMQVLIVNNGKIRNDKDHQH